MAESSCSWACDHRDYSRIKRAAKLYILFSDKICPLSGRERRVSPRKPIIPG